MFPLRPTLCPDEDNKKEFNIRRQLVEYLRLNKMRVPENIFCEENGRFSSIPNEISEQYLSIVHHGKVLDEKSKTKNIKGVSQSSEVLSKQTQSLSSEIPRIVTLFNNGMVSLAQQKLSAIMNDEKLKTIKDLPPDLYDTLPSSLKESRTQFEDAHGARIDSKRLSSLRAEAELYCSPIRKQSGKKIRIKSPEKDDEEVEIDLKEGGSFNMSAVVSSITATRSSSLTHLLRNRSHSKCDTNPCQCNKKVTREGCCDVCRLYFECQCGDCMFTNGHESAHLNAQGASDNKRAILLSESKNFAEVCRKGDQARLGYIYDRRKETVISQSENGREIHDWRVGRLSAYVLSCGNAFVRFYGTSTKTLYGMKNKSSIIAKGNSTVLATSESEGLQNDEYKHVPKKMSKVEVKQFAKRASTIHSVALDDDERASLRWAPDKGSDAVEEAYGWMHGHFKDVAEDMPNR